MDRAALEQLLDRGSSLAEIGRRFGKHEATIAYWLGKYGLSAAHRRTHSARGGLQRAQLEELVESGKTIAEIAAAVHRSKATVRHWLARYGLRTRGTRGRKRLAVAESARQAGRASVALVCPTHGESDFVIDSRGSYRCRRCRAEAVSRRRRRVKSVLVSEAGGRCCICGYARSMRALHFHHLDPAHKRLAISSKGVALAIDVLRAEARKCVLLCSNCHAEVEDGIAAVPPDLAGRYPQG
jgi:transposase